MSIPTFPAPTAVFGASRPTDVTDAVWTYLEAARATLNDGSVVCPSRRACFAAVKAFDAGLGDFPIVVTTDNYRRVHTVTVKRTNSVFGVTAGQSLDAIGLRFRNGEHEYLTADGEAYPAVFFEEYGQHAMW